MSSDRGVSVEIEFNVKDEELSRANTKLKETQASADNASFNLKNLTSTLSKAVLGFATLSAAFSEFKKALNLNIEYESLSNSLASLISINHQNISLTGEAIDAALKWNLSLKESKKTIDELKSAGTGFGYSLSDMSEMFKSFYSTAGGLMSLEQSKEVIKLIAAAANVAGASVDSLKSTLDSVGSGVAQTTTDFGRFITSLGLSTEAMSEAKEQSRLYELFIEKLSPLMQSAEFSQNSYAISLAKLSSTMDDIRQSALAPYFEGLKSALASFNSVLDNNKDNIIAFAHTLISAFSDILAPFKQLATFIWDIFITAFNVVMKQIKNFISLCFDVKNEISSFEVFLKTLQTLGVSLNAVLNMVIESVKSLINYFKKMFLNVQLGAAKLVNLVSNNEDNVKELTAQLLAASSENISYTNKISEIVLNANERLTQIWQESKEENIKQLKEIEEEKIELVRILSAPLPTKKEKIDTKDIIKSRLNIEYEIEARRIELMSEGKEKELALENLRFKKVMENLQAEYQKRIELGEVTKEQVEKLASLENQIHAQRVEQIQTLNKEFDQIKNSFKDALNDGINNVLSGNFNNPKNLFKDLLGNLQSAITKSMATAITNALISSEVMDSFSSCFASIFSSFSSNDNSASGGMLQSFLGGSGESSGMGQAFGGMMAGFGLGSATGGLVNSFLGNKNDEKQQKRTDTLNKVGSAAGSLIGAYWGPIGSTIGGAIGGVVGSLIGSFSSKVTKATGSGLQLLSAATSKYINAREYVDYQQTKKSWWGLKKSNSYWTEYKAADVFQLNIIKQSIRSFEYALKDISGSFEALSIAAGRYSSYAAVANAGAKEFMKKLLSVDNSTLNSIYSYWSSYASNLNKQVNEVLGESLNSYISQGQTYTSWLYNFKGDEQKALRYEAQLLKEQKERIIDMLGMGDVTIDTYLAFREDALKKSFSPETIEQINALGEILMQSAEATKKYEDALKSETKTKLKMIDPFLKKTKALEDNKSDTSEALQLNILATLKAILRVNQEQAEYSFQRS